MRRFLTSRIKSFGFAFKGIAWLVRSQVNAKIHLVATFTILVLGLYLSLSITEWCLILICMGVVIALEAVNTAIEHVVDLASPEYHELAGKAKDLAAAAVLISVLFFAVVWSLIFIPKLLLLIG